MRRRWCCVGGGAFANTPAAAEDAVLELAGAAEKDAPRRTGEPVACCSTAGAVVGVACLFSMALAPCCCRCKHCTSCRRRLRLPHGHEHLRCAGIEICTARGLKGPCHLVATLCCACGSQRNVQYPLAFAALPPLTWHLLPRQHPDCHCPHHHCRDRRRRTGAATCAGNAGMVSRRSSRGGGSAGLEAGGRQQLAPSGRVYHCKPRTYRAQSLSSVQLLACAAGLRARSALYCSAD